MQGYTHTCPACDAKLKIHERYVGRTLHCPTCGTEFLADPNLADIDDIIDELVPAQKRSIPWLPVAAALAVLVVAVLWLGQANRDGAFSKFFKTKRTAGQFAVLTIEGRDRVPAAMDRETVVFLVDAIEDADPGSLDALRAQGKIIDVASGTRVKIIERVGSERTARVRILEGVWTSRVVWVPVLAVQ
jgi:hypothetical protein